MDLSPGVRAGRHSSSRLRRPRRRKSQRRTLVDAFCVAQARCHAFDRGCRTLGTQACADMRGTARAHAFIPSALAPLPCCTPEDRLTTSCVTAIGGTRPSQPLPLGRVEALKTSDSSRTCRVSMLRPGATQQTNVSCFRRTVAQIAPIGERH